MTRVYKTKPERLKKVKERQDACRKLNLCIQNAKHGRAHKGNRCYLCWQKKLANDAHRYFKSRRAKERRFERRQSRRWAQESAP